MRQRLEMAIVNCPLPQETATDKDREHAYTMLNEDYVSSNETK